MNILLYITGGLLFLVSIAGHFFVRIYLRPKNDQDLENCYYEFEDEHPGYARYTRWSQISFAGVAVAALLLLLAAVL